MIILILFLFFSLLNTQLIDELKILEETHLDTALAKIKMTRDDLTFNIDLARKDTFRLKLVNDLFKNPMQSLNVCDSIAEKEWLYSNDLTSLVEYSANLLDVSIDTTYQYDKALQDSIPIADFLQKVDNNFFLAKSLFFQSISDLSAEETKFLYNYSSGLFLYDNTEAEENKEIDLKKMRNERERSYEKTRIFRDVSAKINYENLFNGAFLFSKTAKSLKQYVVAKKDSFNHFKSKLIPGNSGDFLINPTEFTDITEELVVLIDTEGDDEHTFQIKNDFLTIIDLTGNDVYKGKGFSQGTGFWGYSILFDLEGDDIYKGTDYSQGSAFLGMGILYDKNGDDYYSARSFAQGSAAFGCGFLIDEKGNDTYQSTIYSQGFGYVKGLGSIIDIYGNDDYIIKRNVVDLIRYDNHYESLSQGFGFGSRPFISGGIGILADNSGNDSYLSDIYGQGSAYWYALGGLIDKNGNDQYNSYQYAQGAGVHLAFGALLDFAGKDNYVSNGVSQGCGHDYAFGGLFDFKGDDNYVCYDLSQGGGNANAISFFLDVNGDDGYIAKRKNTMGYSDFRRNFGYIGLFMDLNGNDFYGSPWGKNNDYWRHSTYGIGIDSNNHYLDDLAPKREVAAEPADVELGEDIETLFLQSSAPLQSYRHLVDDARKRIIAMGDSAMPFLVKYLDSDHIREIVTLRKVIPKIGSEALPFLEKVLKDSSITKKPFALYLMGKIGDKTAFPDIAEFCGDDEKFRKSAIKALSFLKDKRAVPIFIELLFDEDPAVRRQAAIGLQKINDQNAVIPLIKATNDKYQEVRYSAEIALTKIKPHPTMKIINNFYSQKLISKKHLLGYFGRVKDEKSKEFLLEFLKNEHNEELDNLALDILNNILDIDS